MKRKFNMHFKKRFHFKLSESYFLKVVQRKVFKFLTMPALSRDFHLILYLKLEAFKLEASL